MNSASAARTERLPAVFMVLVGARLTSQFGAFLSMIALPAVKLDFAYGIDVKDYAITLSVTGGGTGGGI